ncbi:hypothetical protein HNY73_009726 [Argiope bruennichi]|uniref:Uncharacterized protein n=1 Tax=Argiope bruennichi TaxID=94029 RepID=A0A8T0FCW2_ARGBR|nr:hypothetical protein HNY73_009726 [Argiope bruennichi]
MDQYRCKRYGNIVTRDEDLPRYFHKKFDYRYSPQEPVESDGFSNQIRATTDVESQMRLENSKWQSLKNDKNNFIYSLECVINKAISDCKKISGTANLIANPDLPSGSEEPENGKRQVSEGETNEHTLLEVHSQGHNKNKKMTTYVKDPIPFKEDDNAVAGPSGMSPLEKKFSCSVIEVQTKANASFVISSENIESYSGSENDHREALKKTIIITGSSVVDIQRQSGSGVSDLMLAIAAEEYKTSLEKGKWQTLNNTKKNFMDSLECVIRKSHSDNNNISGTSNLTINLDLPSGIQEPRNGKIHAS